jgi:hypothetical protein
MATMLCLLACSAASQERVRFELVEEIDRTVRVDKTQEEESHLTERKDGGAPSTYDSSAGSAHQYEETVLAVERGAPRKVRRHYLNATETFADKTGGRKSSRQTSFHGKTVVLTRATGGTQVEGADVLPKDRVQLRLHDDPILRSLPSGEVEPGARWEIDARLLAQHVDAQLGGFAVSDAVGTSRFVGWEQHDGVRCALLETTTRVRAADAGGVRLTLDNRVRHWYAPSRKAVVRVEGDGRQELSGTYKVEASTMTVSGASTTVYRERRAFP